MITGIADLEAFTIINEQHISDGDRGQAVDRPGHDAPVVDGIHMGELVGEVAVGRYAKGRRLDVEDGLGKAPCNQTSTHAGREHHGYPATGGILGRLALGPQKHISVSSKGQPAGHRQRRHAS